MRRRLNFNDLKDLKKGDIFYITYTPENEEPFTMRCIFDSISEAWLYWVDAGDNPMHDNADDVELCEQLLEEMNMDGSFEDTYQLTPGQLWKAEHFYEFKVDKGRYSDTRYDWDISLMTATPNKIEQFEKDLTELINKYIS